MSKAQYLLLALFIGFYGLLFTLLMIRALASVAAARLKRMRPPVVDATRRMKSRARRPWTAALWRNA